MAVSFQHGFSCFKEAPPLPVRGLKWLLLMPVFLLLAGLSGPLPARAESECVVLLHGLWRGAGSMEEMADTLSREGYLTVSIDYPSREYEMTLLAEIAVPEGLQRCREQGATTVHFVTHSLGGLLVRTYAENNEVPDLGRVVMLGPPNQGSEVVDRLQFLPGLELIAGPVVRQLGTDASDIPRSLGPVQFELGVIAGTQAINPVFTLMVPNPDDGVVSVDSARVEGMCAFVQLPVTHTFMVINDRVMEQTMEFLRTGRFSDAAARNDLCRR